MSDPTGTTVLPREVTTAMKTAYAAYSKAAAERSDTRSDAAAELANMAATGRDAGWSVRMLAEPCGITPERLRQIINKYATGEKSKVEFPEFIAPKKAAPKPRSPRSKLTAAERAKLARMAPKAKQNSGSQRLDSKVRKTSEEFSRLIIEFHSRGVIWSELAAATGTHTVSGLRMRAARHGYGHGAPPSIKPYRGIDIHHRESAEAKGKTKTSAKPKAKARAKVSA